MSDKYCPFLIEKGDWLSHRYECKSSNERVETYSALWKTYCSQYPDYEKCPHFKPEPSQSSSCYLTSACVEAMGLADDCSELTTLRDFRDNWLAHQPEGKAEIEHYYATAPKIVESIRKNGNGKEVFHRFYKDIVCPCVEAIMNGNFELAHAIYRAKALELEKEFLKS